ncbi:DUF2806 domain-containing protein [Mesorhizobium sp. M1322]|uniref:DUF2806 domain-containing protein n=1 Tax=Mesorhizobium sp. M1322 TaxID=2957081 RepID=UPI00333AB69C
MQEKDHLDRETSVSAEISATGVKASAKSRFVAAVDRLGGNFVELMNAPMEAWTAEKRARADARMRAIEALTEIWIDRLKTDREFAERALRGHVVSIFVQRENKDAVLVKAIEDLRRQPPTDTESTTGPEVLDDSFVQRFDGYAGSATTDELREKWGRVLAAEIRSPGTFSVKVLRIVDEIDPVVAALFERVCEHRLADVLPKCLVGELPFDDSVKLSEAGLLVEPGVSGQMRMSSAVTTDKGIDQWFWNFGKLGIGLPKSPGVPINDVFNYLDGLPGMSVFVLTQAGASISSILPDNTTAAFKSLAERVSEAVRDLSL